MNYLLKVTFLLMLGSFVCMPAQAQKRTSRKKMASSPKSMVKQVEAVNLADTSSPKVVTITSAFKPYLKDAVKVNFTAASPVIDSSKIPVTYSIPSQNLFFTFQPVAIQPLALAFDTGYAWNNDHYIKFGAGNFSSVLGEAGFSFGNGRNAITNLRGNFVTATGHLPSQQSAKWGLDILSVLHTKNNHEWTTHPYYQSSTQYLYGYQPTTLSYPKDQLLQRFNTVGIEIGLQNKLVNTFGISYHPRISLIGFSDNHENQERNLIIKAPINKSFGKIYAIDLEMGADISATTVQMVPNYLDIKNNLFYVNPSIQLKTPNLKLLAGIRPSWDNQSFSTLPNITVEAKVTEVGLVLEAGWIGYYKKNTMRSLAGMNPFIGQLSGLQNTRIREQYAGIKGATGNHFTYEVKASLLQLNNQALFVNNLGDGKTFAVLFEPEMKALRLHGEIGYTVQEKISLIASATYTQYSSLTVNEKPWGLLPIEATGTVKWKVLKDLQLKADLFVWEGAAYRDLILQAKRAGAVADLNIGAEFAVMPKLAIWLQMNNLFNATYQRWNQYPVLGTQVLAGVVYSFR